LCGAGFSAFFGVLVIAASLPSIQAYYGQVPGHGPRLLSSSLFGLAVGYLVGGLLCDRFGRRRVLLVSLAVSCVLATLSAFASTWTSLQLLRFGQSMAAGASVIVIGPTFRDIYKDNVRQAARANLATFAATALGSVLGVMVGAFLEARAGWHMSFYAIGAVSALSALMCFCWVWETGDLSNGARTPGARWLSFVPTEPGMWQAALLGGVSIASTYVFVAAGPPLVISLWGYPPSTYGLIATIPTILMAVVALAVRRYAAQLNLRALSAAATVVQVLGALFLGYCYYAGRLDAVSFYLAACASYLGNAVLVAYSTSVALSKVSTRIGAASALIGCLHISLGAASTLLPTLGAGALGLQVPLAVLACGICAAGLCASMGRAGARSNP
jgi:MFS family permease